MEFINYILRRKKCDICFLYTKHYVVDDIYYRKTFVCKKCYQYRKMMINNFVQKNKRFPNYQILVNFEKEVRKKNNEKYKMEAL